MDASKWAVVVDQNPFKGQQVENLLRQYYSSLYRPQGGDLRNVSGFIDMNSGSIDIIVVSGDYGNLKDVLEKHRQYRLPTIIRSDNDSRIKPDIFTLVANGYYRPVAVLGMPQSQDIPKYLEAAQKRAATFQK